MYIVEFTKAISNVAKLQDELLLQFGSLYKFVTIKGDYLQIAFNSNLNQTQINTLSYMINNFVEISVVAQLKDYVEKSVKPFVDNLMFSIQAENIGMGITTDNRTAEVLGFFTDRITLPGNTRGVSIKDTVDTNSLTVTYALLLYYISNPELYDDLSPYITVERLTNWKDRIAVFLGIT